MNGKNKFYVTRPATLHVRLTSPIFDFVFMKFERSESGFPQARGDVTLVSIFTFHDFEFGLNMCVLT